MFIEVLPKKAPRTYFAHSSFAGVSIEVFTQKKIAALVALSALTLVASTFMEGLTALSALANRGKSLEQRLHLFMLSLQRAYFSALSISMRRPVSSNP